MNTRSELNRVDESVRANKRKRNNRIGIAVIVALSLGTIAFNGDEESDKTDATVEAASQSPVFNSEWDGSVAQVTNHLKSTLNDWGSYESMEWSAVVPSQSGTYLVRHKYRAANGFGAKIIVHQYFEVSADGQIVSVTDF